MSKDGFETISISDEVNKKITEYQKEDFLICVQKNILMKILN